MAIVKSNSAYTAQSAERSSPLTASAYITMPVVLVKGNTYNASD